MTFADRVNTWISGRSGCVWHVRYGDAGITLNGLLPRLRNPQFKSGPNEVEIESE